MASNAHDPHADHAKNPAQQWVWPITIGALATIGAVMVAPNILPMVGIGDEELSQQVFAAMHTTEGSYGTGAAGAVNTMLSKIPLFGEGLAQGGLFTALTCGGIGLGGIVLGDYVEKREDKSMSISIGKTIKAASMITSALIALPAILTGISIGIVYLCGALGDKELASQAIGQLYNTIGSSHKLPGPAGVVGIMAAASHVGTCGIPVVSTLLGMSNKNETQIPPKPINIPATKAWGDYVQHRQTLHAPTRQI